MGSWAAVSIAAFLVGFSFAHFNRRLKAACVLSAFFYFTGYALEELIPLKPDHFYFFQALDLFWGLMLLVFARGPILAVIACCLNWLLLGYLPLKMDYAQWHYYFPAIYVTLQFLLVASLTALPLFWPNRFTLPLPSLIPSGWRKM